VTRVVRLGAAAMAGLVFGAGAMLIVQGSRGLAGDGATSSSPTPTPTSTPTSTPTLATATSAIVTSVTTPPDGEAPATTTLAPAVLAWSPGGLPAGFAEAVAFTPGVAGITVVRGDPLTLTASLDANGAATGASPPPGMVVDLDAIAIVPSTFARFAERADRAAIRALAPGQALLGDTSAQLRGVGPGDQLVLGNGAAVTVAGVVDDSSVGAAEVVVDTSTGTDIGVTTPRYLLAEPEGASADTVAAVNAAADPTMTLRVRARGETPYLRSSDAVLPQSRMKAVFGEFTRDPRANGDDLALDPAWVRANIVEAEVPVLGVVRCHRALFPALRGALQELADRNLAGLVQTYDGCYNPRRIRSGDTISRHAWGAAVDLNFTGNATGVASIQDPRLVEVMARWGFGSGDGWLVPDPGHFEYVGPPRP